MSAIYLKCIKNGLMDVQNRMNKNKHRASPVAQWLGISCQCRGHGFEPWSGGIPHAVEQLSPCATATEPVC